MSRPLLLLILILLPVAQGLAQTRWTAEFNVGLPWSVPSPVWIAQKGEPGLTVQARWSAQAFELPLNWMWRIGRWNGNRGWEFETIHHKMVMINRPEEIQWFGITHGFNTLTINRAWESGHWVIRAGAGGVLAHPESTIRHQAFNEQSGLFNLGYYLTGPLLLGSVARPVRLFRFLQLNLEGTFTAGYAKVPIAGGTARTIAVAFHLHAGIGVAVGGKSDE